MGLIGAPPPFRPVSVKVEIEDVDEQPHVVKPKKSIPRIPPPTFDPEEDERKDAEKERKALDAYGDEPPPPAPPPGCQCSLAPR